MEMYIINVFNNRKGGLIYETEKVFNGLLYRTIIL